MFYSGWNFPMPQYLKAGDAQLESRYVVHRTPGSGVSLVHLLQPSGQQGEVNNRLHLKSDTPIHPNSGVFYFEAEVRTMATGDEGGSTELGLVIGICRESLHPFSLPGEEPNSVGLFTSKHMVYADGRGEGDVVRLPPGGRARSSAAHGEIDDAHCASSEHRESRRSKGMRVGDNVGCIVNLLCGTVSFTFNGELLNYSITLSSRTGKVGYYAAIGFLCQGSAVSLRVTFPPSCRQPYIPRAPGAGVDEECGAAHPVDITLHDEASQVGCFAFDIDRYCEGIVKGVVHDCKSKAKENPSSQSALVRCRCHDPSILSAIRKHLAARGMTRALSAFIKEQDELTCVRPDCGGRPSNEAKSGPKFADPTDTMQLRGPQKNCGSPPCRGGGMRTEDVIRAVTYSDHIRQLRKCIDLGEVSAVTERILKCGVLHPEMIDKVKSFVEGVDTLPHDFWGLVFFAQRRDILFLLRAAHVVESTFDIMKWELQQLLRRLQPADGSKIAVGEAAGSVPTATAVGKEVKVKVMTVAELMEFAYNCLLEPFQNVETADRRHRQLSCGDMRTGDAVAFGSFESGCAEGKKSFEELAAHLFVSGQGSLWSSPEAPVTLLVRQSMPKIPPPKKRRRQQLVQTLTTLVSHQKVVCKWAEQHHKAGVSCEWVRDWLSLVEDIRHRCRTRCLTRLLHAIEDFNGALDYRLALWQRNHERRMSEVSAGGSLEQRGASVVLQRHEEVSSNTEKVLEEVTVKESLFPSLRSVWRHVHAAAALEPLLNVVTKTFCDKFNSTVAGTRVAVEPVSTTNSPPTFDSGPKRVMLHSPEPSVSETDKENDEEEDVSNKVSPHGSSGRPRAAPTGSDSKEGGIGTDVPKKGYCYVDDLRISFLYMKSVYKNVFA
uniref:Uncharacterized protein TCIL3000_8_6200 n=1 Tax=Trypanosoma congolense (strain IL3000) TaxID=1068625 RepID=G0USN0_TRYCI|nr:unnamed protein product [Trypanosoma congolense IL3000]